MIYASGVPNKIFNIKFSYNSNGQIGDLNLSVNPFTSILRTRSLKWWGSRLILYLNYNIVTLTLPWLIKLYLIDRECAPHARQPQHDVYPYPNARTIIVHNILTNQRQQQPSVLADNPVITMNYEYDTPTALFNDTVKDRIRARSFYDTHRKYADIKRTRSKNRMLNEKEGHSLSQS